jgi:hypothetical protein
VSRVWKRISVVERQGCLLVNSHKPNKGGYIVLQGRSATGTYSYYLHRRVYEILIGIKNPKNIIHHTCERKDCINIFHLEETSQSKHRAIHGSTR